MVNVWYKRIAIICSAIIAFTMMWSEMPVEGKEKMLAQFASIWDRPMVLYEQIMTLENPWQVIRIPALFVVCKLLAIFFRQRVDRAEAATNASEKPAAKGGDDKGATRSAGKKARKDKAA